LTDLSGSNTTTSTYNDIGWNLTSTDSVTGTTTTYVYDADHNVITETDPSNGGGAPDHPQHLRRRQPAPDHLRGRHTNDEVQDVFVDGLMTSDTQGVGPTAA
jgi:YD repeat-containing protein